MLKWTRVWGISCSSLILNYKENADAQVSHIHDSWSDKSIQQTVIRFRVLHHIRVRKKAFGASVIIQCVFCLFSFWALLMCHCFQMISTETAVNNINRQLWLSIDCGSENTGLLVLQASQKPNPPSVFLLTCSAPFYTFRHLCSKSTRICKIGRMERIIWTFTFNLQTLKEEHLCRVIHFLAFKIPKTNRPMMPRGEK